MKDLLSQAIALELALSFWRSELINARVLGHKASSFSTADTDPSIYTNSLFSSSTTTRRRKSTAFPYNAGSAASDAASDVPYDERCTMICPLVHSKS